MRARSSLSTGRTEFHHFDNDESGLNAAIIAGLTRIGFKLVNFDPNLVAGKNETSGLLLCYELLFRKVKLPCES